MTWLAPTPLSSVSGAGSFRSPYASYAGGSIPLDFRAALRWCESMYEQNATYRQASERIVSYFLTDITVGAADSGETIGDDVREKWLSLFRQKLDVLGAEYLLGLNRAAYGNAFVSLLAPFKRHLVCPTTGCGTIVPLAEAYRNPEFSFRFEQFEFRANCPRCKKTSSWRVWDEPLRDPAQLRFKFWSPHEIHIKHDLYTDDVSYIWRIPDDYKQQVRNGELFVLERVGKQVLAAIRNNELFEFDRDAVFHSREPTIAGHRNRGWGLSRLLVNSRQLWYVELLHRQNEAIALDYITPLRLISPANGASGGAFDPLARTSSDEFKTWMSRLISERRKNPTSWSFAPMPVQLQQLSGDGSRLAPKDLLDQGYEMLLNGIGTPMEMYRGTMQLQAAPVALRMFEANWHHLTQAYNMFLRWVANRICQLLQWEAVAVRHERVTHADDMQKQMAMMQMASMGQASMTTAFKQLGLDWQDEQRAIMDEARFQQEQQTRMQKEMDQAAFGQQVLAGQAGGAPPIDPATGQPLAAAPGQAGAAQPLDPMTGQPLAAGPVTQMLQGQGVPQTPDDMLQQAEAIAHELFGKPSTVQLSELRALRQKNPTMHALVMQRRDDIRNRARSQGGAQLMQQQYGSSG